MQRTIKSFVLRAGRVSPRQQTALDQWLKEYALETTETVWCWKTIFGRNADTIIEIGFGMGASLIAMAKAHPEKNFVGIEVHRAGIGSLVADLHEHGITNVRVVPADAVTTLQSSVADGSVAGIQLFFPDPWPKKRHHKRRLLQAEIVQLFVKKLRIGGFIHCATDWEEYAAHMLAVLSAESRLGNVQIEGGFSPRPDSRPLTKFEARGQRLGHGVWDLIFCRLA